MNFDGFSPYPLERWSSLVEQDDQTVIPPGVSPYNRNIRYHLTSARVRDGIQNAYGFLLPDGGAVTGLAALKIGGTPGDLQVPVAFSSLGNFYKESPPGSGRVVPLTPTFGALPVGCSLQAAAAFAKGFFAFTDLKQSEGSPLVYNPATGFLDPCSMKLAGQLWSPNTAYVIGEVVTPATPVGGNGHSYRCAAAGTSGAVQPVFPINETGAVADGTTAWAETTPLMAQALTPPGTPVVNRSAGAGTFAANRDVYIVITLVNGQGETTICPAFVFVNTTLNDRFVVTGPILAQAALWIQALVAPYAITGYNVYEADVATGSGAPALATYKKVNVGVVALGVNTNVNTTGTGAAPPTTNGALLVPAGNICAGLRFMVVLFLNRNGYVTGMTAGYVVSYNGSSNGFQLYTAYLPRGPANTAARICCFTPAGQLNQLAGTGISNAGPYFWIPPSINYLLNGQFSLSAVPPGVTVNAIVNGVTENSTLINDNVTTTATFNFDDNYLKSFTQNDVSSYFRKIPVPNCSDVWYSETLRRMFYADDALPSGWRVSLAGDPESLYGDTGLIQVAENNGQNRTAIREFQGVIYPMKEKSGHVLNPDVSDPSSWRPTQQWTGSGPCGPRAVDVCTTFMCYVHRSGVWIFQGTKPFRISKELPITWKNINWAYKQTIWVLIDDETSEIRIGVPYGKSTVPNLVLKCNYEESVDFAPPIHFSPYIGKEIASGAAYKWTIDDIAANLAIRAERTLTMGLPANFDQPTIDSQILYASSNQDGAVAAIVPFVFDDNGVGIDSVYETACPEILNGDGKVVRSMMGPNKLGGVQANIDGYGPISMEVLALRAKEQKQGGPPLAGQSKATAGDVIRLKKDCIAGVPYSCGGRMTNERMRLRISNNKKPGVWFDIKKAWLFASPITTARPS